MSSIIDIAEFLERMPRTVLVDVRSPSEYQNGHIPGAYNIPLFDDEERKIIGTIYHQKGSEKAALKGLEIAGPKMTAYVQQLKEIAGSKKILVYCWRGGKRSEAMTFVFHIAGYHVFRLKQGYKVYRRHIHQAFEKKRKLIVIGGMTGSGKTKILHYLRKKSLQVIDLEGLANHKGSSFGAIDENEQPTTEQFENKLYSQWMQLDPGKPVFLEDESMDIGKVKIPYPLFRQMRNAPVVKLHIDIEERAVSLAKDYSGNDHLLKEAFERIAKRLGGQNHKAALQALEEKKYEEAARIALRYYDKTYAYGISKRNPETIFALTPSSNSVEQRADEIIHFVRKNITQ